MIIKEFMEQIENNYSKYFDGSICKVRIYRCLGTSLTVDCLLAKDKTEVSNGIWQNDMFSITFNIDAEIGELDRDITVESELPSKLVLESYDRSYTLKPTIEYMAYSGKSVQFRKTKGDGAKLIKTLDKFFSRLHEELKSDIIDDKIHEHHIELLKKRIN